MKKYSMSALQKSCQELNGAQRSAPRADATMALLVFVGGKMKHMKSPTSPFAMTPTASSSQQGLFASYKDRDHKHSLMADYRSQSKLPHLEKNNAFVS